MYRVLENDGERGVDLEAVTVLLGVLKIAESFASPRCPRKSLGDSGSSSSSPCAAAVQLLYGFSFLGPRA